MLIDVIMNILVSTNQNTSRWRAMRLGVFSRAYVHSLWSKTIGKDETLQIPPKADGAYCSQEH